MRYISIEEILQAHEALLKEFGGSSGIRDKGLLESAIQRPQSSVFGEDAYSSVIDKSAAICHSILFNHAFVDGNKRTAFAACHLTLMLNGYDLTATPLEIYDFLIGVIKDRSDWTVISIWLKERSKKRSKGAQFLD